jgi:hypothetical protein
MRTIVTCIHLYKAEQRLLNGPLPRGAFFDPVTSDCEISISIASLPRITRKADFTTHSGALK